MKYRNALKYIIPLMLTLSPLFAGRAQNGFNLPYSQFGMGSPLLPYSSGLANGMGGTMYAIRGANYINPYNPASYSAVENQSFVLDIGMTMQRYTLSDNANTLRDADGNLDHLAFAFPVTGWWRMAMGLTPYSETQYESMRVDLFDGSYQVKTVYDGMGDIYRLFWGNGFVLNEHLSIGFNLNYLYGDLNRSIKYDVMGSDTNYFVDSRKRKNTHISSVTFDVGAQYVTDLDERNQLTVGLSLQLPRKLTTHDTSWVYTLVEGSENANSVIDTIYYSSKARLPLGVGLGVALEHSHKWRFSTDLHYAPWNGMKYEEGLAQPVFPQSSVRYVGNFTAAVAVSWLGNASSSSYWKRIGVSLGAHYDRGQLGLALTTGDERIDEYGAGLSFMFPIRKGRSRIQLSTAYSSMGTNDLLRVECFTIGLTLSSCEQWFVKRKYN